MIQTQANKVDYGIVGLAYLSFVALGLPGGLLGVAWPSIRETFSLPASGLGTLLLFSTIGVIIASFFSGRIITYIGIGPALLLASLCGSVGLFGYSLAPSWAAIVLVGLLVGVSMGIVDAGMNLFFANNYSPRLMNWLHASFGLGAALGPLILTTLFSIGESWRWAYAIAGIVQLILAGAFALTLKRWKVDIHAEDTTPAHAPSIIRTIKQPIVLLSILLFFFFTGVESTAGNWSYTLFTEARGIDIIVAGQWVSLYWWSFTFGRLIFGVIANRIPIMVALWGCMMLALLGAALLSNHSEPIVGFLGLGILGFAIAPIFPLLITLTPQRLGRNYATHAIGFQVAAANLGLAALPALAGYWAEDHTFEIIGPFLIGLTLLTIIVFQIINSLTTPRVGMVR